MGTCNYCALKEIRRRAKKENSTISIKPAPNMPGNGVNVYLHPEHIEITDENREDYFDSWLMSLPDKCCC